jgi:hypothetical protein
MPQSIDRGSEICVKKAAEDEAKGKDFVDLCLSVT